MLSKVSMLLHTLTGVPSPFVPLLLLLGALLPAWAWRRLRRKRRAGFHPVRRSRPPWASRIAEGSLLFTIGATLIVYVGTSPFLNGFLLMPGRVHPQFTLVTRFFAALAGVLVLFGTVFVLRGFFRHGFALVLFTVIAYPFILAGPLKIPEKLAPEAEPKHMTHLIIKTESNLPGVEIWINDVYLGKTPLEITGEEFNAKVPYWPEHPEGFVPKEDRRRISDDESKDDPEAPADPPWTMVEIPDFGGTAGSTMRPFYTRLRFGDEWGGASVGSTGGDGNGSRRNYNISLSVQFERSLVNSQNLLIQARLADYRIGEEWLRAMETYGRQGWQQLWQAALNETRFDLNSFSIFGPYRRLVPEIPGATLREPGLAEVADRWAEWRYGIRPDMTPDEAWDAFETICEEIDRTGVYETNSPAGRAVELLVPMVDEERIVETAVRMIRRNTERGLATAWTRSGSFFTFRHTSNTRDPARMYPIAHAVWKLDRDLDARDDSRPNIVEERIVPAILCWWGERETSLDAALYLGGGHGERFLLRQDFDEKPSGRSPNAMRAWNGYVNRWLYRAALLNSPAGKKFRQDHAGELLDLAEKMIEPHGELDGVDFLFMDKELGADSLAMRFWPRYRNWTTGKGEVDFSKLRDMFTYLIHMEPATPLELYVDLCRDSPVNSLANAVVGFFNPFDNLPPARRKEIYRAMLEEVEKNRDYYLRRLDEGRDEEWLELYVVSALRSYAGPAEPSTGPQRTHPLYLEWRGYRGLDYRRLVLEEKGPEQPDIERLARDGNPENRIGILRALRAYPVGKNLELLEELRNDPDEKVRTAAEETMKELDELAKTPPSEFAVPGSGGDQ